MDLSTLLEPREPSASFLLLYASSFAGLHEAHPFGVYLHLPHP